MAGEWARKVDEFPEDEYGKFGTPERRRNLQKHSHLFRIYGLTLKAYRNMSESQGHKCAICGKEENGKHNRGSETISLQLSVDHDHITGDVRALLCTKCNKALGLFNDNIDLLQDALEYLKSHRSGG